jgi:hypothetical protein
MKDWSQQACAILASGPSLTQAQVDLACANMKTVAINSTWEIAPNADVLYGGDFLWHKVNHAAYRKHFRGEVWTQDSTAADRYQIKRVKGTNREGLGIQCIHNNGNSLAQAINLVYLWGCRRILLLGADMKLGHKGERHWHADHPAPLIQSQMFDEWLFKGAKLAADLKANDCTVLNCTPGSAWTDFPMSTIEKELQCQQP